MSDRRVEAAERPVSKARPGGYGPAVTRLRDGHCIVVCGICGHESIGDTFINVVSEAPRDAWWRHRLHVDAKHALPSEPLRAFAEFVVSLDNVEMRRSITLTKLIRQARKALDE